jgi:hypothetical protein
MAAQRLSRGDIAVSWEDQVQKAVACYNAGASVLHVRVRDPKPGKISKTFDEYRYLLGPPAVGVLASVADSGSVSVCL